MRPAQQAWGLHQGLQIPGLDLQDHAGELTMGQGPRHNKPGTAAHCVFFPSSGMGLLGWQLGNPTCSAHIRERERETYGERWMDWVYGEGGMERYIQEVMGMDGWREGGMNRRGVWGWMEG